MSNQNKEVTLNSLIWRVIDFVKEIWRNKFIVIGGALLLAIAFAGLNSLKPTKYEARLTFMINDDEGGGMGGVSAILGQFGLGGSGGGKYNYQKLSEIALSDKILTQVLLDSATIANNNDFIANHVINLFGFHEMWEEDTLLNGYLFNSENTNVDARNFATRSLINYLSEGAKSGKGDRIIDIQFSEESTVMALTSSSVHEEFAIAVVNSWYDKLSHFYVSKSVEKQAHTYKQLSAKADSIRNLLAGSEASLARSKDRELGLVLAQDKLPSLRSRRNLEMYAEMYGEVLKNKETAEFLLNNSTPFLQVIDIPFKPLNATKPSLILQIIKGLLVGGFLAALFIIARMLIREFRESSSQY